MMSELKILICGAGVAGNALGFWLSKLGHNITIIERSTNLRTTGLQIDLRGHGVGVLRRMGLEEAFRAVSIREEGFKVVDKAGRQKAYFPANRGKGLQSFTTDFEIMRGDLVQLLHNTIKEKVHSLFGVTIQSFEDQQDCVSVLFSDGTRENFDLLVGADGQGSHTRQMILGPNEKNHVQVLNSSIGYFTIASPLREGEQYVATTYIATGSRTIMTRRQGPNRLQVYLGCDTRGTPMEHVAKSDVEGVKKAFAQVFKNAGWHSDEIIQSLQDSNDLYCERPALVRMKPWSRGRVALVGDAAYCPTVNTGMGTTSSMVGAYILAGEISKISTKDKTEPELRIALESYEQIFRPFMDQVQRGVADDESNWTNIMPSSAFGIAVLHFILGILSFLRIDVLGRFALREQVKNWDLPEYSSLHDA